MVPCLPILVAIFVSLHAALAHHSFANEDWLKTYPLGRERYVRLTGLQAKPSELAIFVSMKAEYYEAPQARNLMHTEAFKSGDTGFTSISLQDRPAIAARKVNGGMDLLETEPPAHSAWQHWENVDLYVQKFTIRGLSDDYSDIWVYPSRAEMLADLNMQEPTSSTYMSRNYQWIVVAIR